MSKYPQFLQTLSPETSSDPISFSKVAATILVLTFLSLTVVALLMETRFAFLKPEDICSKQNFKIFQSPLKKKNSIKTTKKVVQTQPKNETENILLAPTEHLVHIST